MPLSTIAFTTRSAVARTVELAPLRVLTTTPSSVLSFESSRRGFQPASFAGESPNASQIRSPERGSGSSFGPGGAIRLTTISGIAASRLHNRFSCSLLMRSGMNLACNRMASSRKRAASLLATPASRRAVSACLSASAAFPSAIETNWRVLSRMSLSIFPALTWICNSPATPIATERSAKETEAENENVGFVWRVDRSPLEVAPVMEIFSNQYDQFHGDANHHKNCPKVQQPIE